MEYGSGCWSALIVSDAMFEVKQLGGSLVLFAGNNMRLVFWFRAGWFVVFGYHICPGKY